MRRLIPGVVLACVVLSATAADDSIFGTHWVKFQPVQVSGQLQGCSLVYLAVQADRVYLNGNPVGVNGSIVLRSTQDNRLALTLKIGLRDMTKGSSFERPAFAYLQTASGATAKVRQQSVDGDEGYRLFVYDATDPVILEIVKEMIGSSNVTIGYNRSKGEMDVLVQLDFTVVDSDYMANQKVKRKHSLESAIGFSDCVGKVVDDVLGKLGKKQK
jgi:hypothetical protein